MRNFIGFLVALSDFGCLCHYSETVHTPVEPQECSDHAKQVIREINPEQGIFDSDNGKSPFKWEGEICRFKNTILEFMVLCDYFPEIVERLKNKENITRKDIADVEIKTKLINKIFDLRQRYLRGEKGIEVKTLFDLIVNFFEDTVKNFTIASFLNNWSDIFLKIARLVERKYRREGGIADIASFYTKIYKARKYETSDIKEFENKKQKFKIEGYNYRSGYNLIIFLEFIDTYVIKIFDTVEDVSNGDTSFVKYNVGSRSFKIIRTVSPEDLQKNSDKTIILDVNVVHISSGIPHSSAIIKPKDNNNLYYDSYNDYIKVNKNNLQSIEMQKILDEHSKISYSTKFDEIYCLVHVI